MKFVGEVLGSIKGVHYFYIIGLIIFVTLFIIILYRTNKIPKKDLISFKTSIFENDEVTFKDTRSIDNVQ